jgi:hypothetical protein
MQHEQTEEDTTDHQITEMASWKTRPPGATSLNSASNEYKNKSANKDDFLSEYRNPVIYDVKFFTGTW